MKYEDENGDLKEAQLDGMMSRVCQHEYDHQAGILMVQKVSKMKLDMAYKKAEKEMDKWKRYQKAAESGTEEVSNKELKPWQKGFELDYLKELEKRFNSYNEYAQARII